MGYPFLSLKKVFSKGIAIPPWKNNQLNKRELKG